MPSANNLVELRQLLAERFPRVRMALPSVADPLPRMTTGIPGLDFVLGGGLPRGAITELVGIGVGSGSGLVLHGLLRQAATRGRPLALVDGSDSFDVAAVPQSVLAHLLWVRCNTAESALRAADLLLRDPNCSLVAIDLKLNSSQELRRISPGIWHRFARLVEENATTALVITPKPLIGGVACRVQCENRLAMDALTRVPSGVLSTLQFSLLRSLERGETPPKAKAG